jgi:cell division protein FtsQ
VLIEEHEPLAKWGGSGLVSQKGYVFNEMVGDDLPVFIGPEASAELVTKQYAVFSEMLKPINMQIVKLKLTERTAWQLMTQSGMTIELGRTEVEARLKRFVRVYQSTIEKLNKKLMYADLRYPNGFAIRKPSEPVL